MRPEFKSRAGKWPKRGLPHPLQHRFRPALAAARLSPAAGGGLAYCAAMPSLSLKLPPSRGPAANRRRLPATLLLVIAIAAAAIPAVAADPLPRPVQQALAAANISAAND